MDHSELNYSYYNEGGSIARDFLVPCLKQCTSYRRLTYSFSSAVIQSWAGSFAHIVSNDVKIEILCDMSTILASDEQLLTALESSKNEAKKRELINSFQEKILYEALLFDADDSKYDSRIKLIDWLMANDQLKIKFAYPKKNPDLPHYVSPLYHYKMGYLTFPDSSKVAFSGSWNETMQGGSFNGENCQVFSSERAGDLDRMNEQISKIDHDWNELNEKFYIFTPSRQLIKRIKDRAPKSKEDIDLDELMIEFESLLQVPTKVKTVVNEAPEFTELDLDDHQLEVLESWEKNNRRGLVKHATGSGKTFTAIFALKRHLEKHQIALIIVPSILLQRQWNTEIARIIPECRDVLNAGGNFKDWKKNLSSWSKPSRQSNPKLIIAVADSASSDEFLDKLYQGEHLMIIADEVHTLGSNTFSKILNIDAGSRLGLSATPERYNDPEGTEKIFNYFHGVLEPEFTLKDAIGKSLVPYDYYPLQCNLTAEELDDWKELSDEIGRIAARCKRNKNQEIIPSKLLQLKLIERSRIAKRAFNKIAITGDVLSKNFVNGQSWLVYCESINQIELIQQELQTRGLYASIYHSQLSPQVKERTFNAFENDGGIMLSIKCLDEGIDLPSISHALIIASDQNPRQFIQRRGRVLRRDRSNPNKRMAFLYDLVVCSSTDDIDDPIRSLAITELRRSLEFGSNAKNNHVCTMKIREIATKAKLNLEDIIMDEFIEVENAD
jgi:superfamily II DNA or RNA helicase